MGERRGFRDVPRAPFEFDPDRFNRPLPAVETFSPFGLDHHRRPYADVSVEFGASFLEAIAGGFELAGGPRALSRAARAGSLDRPLVPRQGRSVSGPLLRLDEAGTVTANLHALVAARAPETPDAAAVIDAGDTASYARLMRRADAVRGALRGVGLTAVLLGALGAGATYVPLDPSDPRERLARLLETSGARAVIGDGPLLDALSAAGGRFDALEARELPAVRRRRRHRRRTGRGSPISRSHPAAPERRRPSR